MKKEAIKKLRQSLGLSQEKFAQKIGVSRATVAKWEAGDFKPSPLAMMQIERLIARPKKKSKKKGGK